LSPMPPPSQRLRIPDRDEFDSKYKEVLASVRLAGMQYTLGTLSEAIPIPCFDRTVNAFH